ncbi:MAG: 3-deoxy-7-phosphoheptulonate synthase [Deltaproteobacteria bacterium]|nr:3-deoxy-7-phosphoheptulonate synthase [Deltaproteobacteria bacterium]
MPETSNINISGQATLPTPAQMKSAIPSSPDIKEAVWSSRNTIENILIHKDKRHLIIVGPCSIHNTEGALAYAERLKRLRREVADRIYLVMRVYFEKPRTSLGWKGLIYDPDMDGSDDIEKGLKLARNLLLEIAQMGVAAASEVLDPVTPQYIIDLVSWAAIGARTAESQTHRQLASGLSMPIGFKNGTDGNIQVAIEAIRTAASTHSFIGVMNDGRVGVFKTRGNRFGHLVLRGGFMGPNYGAEYIAFARELMKKAGITPNIIVDCSHGNSFKKPEKQGDVLLDILQQIGAGETSITGTMLESNLKPGSQKINDPNNLDPEISVTDACLGWDATESLIRQAYAALKR